MTDMQYDVVVIGGGPGGYVAAIRAAQLGMKAAVVESTHLGGICLNWGCIPTKTLLRASEINHLLHDLGRYGFAADNPRFDLEKVVGRSRQVARQFSRGIGHLLKKAGAASIEGRGRLGGMAGDARVVEVTKDGTTTTIAARHVIVATGARARRLPGLEPDGEFVWSYREAMVPKEIPKRLLVLGSGAIGVEFASFYHHMGASVVLAEIADRVMPVEDEEISALARKSFIRQGIKVLTGAKIGPLDKADGVVSVAITVDGKTETHVFDRVIAAVGITANTEDLGLEGTKVELDRGNIRTDGFCRTAEPGIYAIGDVAGAPWLAHKASHEGVLCVEAIAGRHVTPLHPLNIPGCTYCQPQVASVGLTEARARAAGHDLRIGRFPLAANGRAQALGESEGLVKTIYDARTGELLGAHMIGAEVTEMIQGFVIARTNELTDAELRETVFAHPTISETMHESTLAASGEALHI